MRITGIIIVAVLLAGVPVHAENFQLAFPVDCTLGQDCIIQNYVDLDPGEGWRDYQCGFLTYDGHKGTDIRIRDYQAVEKGVIVRAAAAGTVLGVRNDMADRRPGEDYEAYLAQITGKECGNGVVIAHQGGFQTQYCHLKEGSVAVNKGAAVKEGELLGEIGMSGKTQFPHLHISVRHGTEVIGPFTGACSESDNYLWKDRISYTGTQLLKSGFSDRKQTLDSIELGEAAELDMDSAVLLFWANVVGIQAGDQQEITIFWPDGTTLAEHSQAVEKSKVNWLSYIGRKRPARGWPKGTYTARYRLARDGEQIIERQFAAELN